MLTFLRSKIRQAGYRWLTFSDEPLYLLVEKMYRHDPRPLRTVTPHPVECGFLIASFSHPDFSRYRGREIAFFNARHVTVYWLPGARHSGGGYVKPGTYTLTMGGHAMRQPVQLLVDKDDGDTVIRSVSPAMQAGCSMVGCRVSFRIIATELHWLACRWFMRMHEQLDALPDDASSLHEAIAAARALTGFDDLSKLAGLLQTRLAARGEARRHGEGRSDADIACFDQRD